MQKIERDFNWAQGAVANASELKNALLEHAEADGTPRSRPLHGTQREISSAPEGCNRQQRRAYERREAKLAKLAAKAKVPA